MQREVSGDEDWWRKKATRKVVNGFDVGFGFGFGFTSEYPSFLQQLTSDPTSDGPEIPLISF